MWFTLSITITLIAAVLLILVVLAQNPKGGGLSSTFGGSGGQLIGVKKTSDLLEKLTWGLAITIVIFSLTSSFVLRDAAPARNATTPNIQEAEQQRPEPFGPLFDEIPEDQQNDGQELLIPEEDTLSN